MWFDRLFDRGWETWRWSDARGEYVRVTNPRKKPPTRTARPPRTVRIHILTATAPDGSQLKYVGGIKFARRGHAVRFASKGAAQACAAHLQGHFPVLRKFKLKST